MIEDSKCEDSLKPYFNLASSCSFIFLGLRDAISRTTSAIHNAIELL